MARELVLRRLRSGEAALFRELRLRALDEAPDQFGETLSHVAARSEDQWRDLAATVTEPNSQAVFIAELGGTPVASVYALHDASDSTIGRLGGMWVARNARRQGIASALFRELHTWAVRLGKKRIRLWVLEDSTPGKRLYENLGFRSTGVQRLFPGNSRRCLLEMEIVLADPIPDAG